MTVTSLLTMYETCESWAAGRRRNGGVEKSLYSFKKQNTFGKLL